MKTIFKWLTKEGNDPYAFKYVKWFTSNFNPENFSGIDRLLMCYLKYCSKLSIVPKRDFLLSYLKVDGKEDILKYDIKTNTMTVYDYKQNSQLEEAYRVIINTSTAIYDDYCNIDLEGRDFKVDMYDFISTLKSYTIQEVMTMFYPKFVNGSDPSEASKELKRALTDIDKIYDVSKIKKLETIKRSGSDKGDMEFICKTKIPCVDGDIGGIYSTLVYTLNAQPGSGKTRLGLVHFAYNVMIEAKGDVLFYETELSESQTINILIAFHIANIYGGRIKIPDSLMNKQREMTKEQLQIYESAKIDLFESGKYGKFIFKEDVVIETMEEEIRYELDTNTNIKLLVIDYMGLIDSIPDNKYLKRLIQYEIITEGYKITRRILKDYKRLAALCINQYNDDGITAAYAGKQIRPGHVQGGHITQRHTDYDMSMTFTEEQELANVRMLSITKKRGAAGFKNVMFKVDLSISSFKQEVKVSNSK